MSSSQLSNAGIATDQSGERYIPESKRADGSVRKAIKVRPGYRPPEDVEVYKNRTAETFRNRGKGPVLGAEGLKDDDKPAAQPTSSSSAAANKNARRREARKKAKAAGGQVQAAQEGGGGGAASGPEAGKEEEKEEEEQQQADPEAEREKKARTLKKKLRQAKELREKKETGEALLPEQIAKVIKINELIRELDALGFDADGELKAAAADAVGGSS